SELIREIQSQSQPRVADVPLENAIEPEKSEGAEEVEEEALAKLTDPSETHIALPEIPLSTKPAIPTAPPAQASGNSGAAGNSPDETIRVSLARLEKLLNFVGELVILQTVLKEQ